MAEQLVSDAVNGNPVVVFSKTYCPFCKMAKDALKQAGLPEKDYVIYELDERGEKEMKRCDIFCYGRGQRRH